MFLYEFVTGGGLAGQELPASWAAEGHAMRRALAEDFASVPGVRLTMTLDDRLPDEPGPWTVVRVTESTEERTFLRLAAEADDTLVIAPETELFLLDRTEAVERGGGRLISCGSPAVRLAGNKYEMGRRLEQHGLPTPPTFWRGLEDRVEDDLRVHFHEPGDPSPPPGTRPLPAVLKSNHGAGSMDTFLVQSFETIPDGFDGDIFQPLVPGEARSASFLVGLDGRAHLVGMGRQRMVVSDGKFAYLGGVVPAGDLPCDPSLRSAVELLDGARGWVGVDYLWDVETSSATVLEINPRVTTSYVGLRRLLPAGELARIWLAVQDDPGHPDGPALSARVHSQAPRRFDADGSCGPELRGDTR